MSCEAKAEQDDEGVRLWLVGGGGCQEQGHLFVREVDGQSDHFLATLIAKEFLDELPVCLYLAENVLFKGIAHAHPSPRTLANSWKPPARSCCTHSAFLPHHRANWQLLRELWRISV